MKIMPKSVGHEGGLFCYLITPFKENGDVNLSALERLVDGVIESGTDGVTCVASTTEGPYLTENERFEIVEKTCEVAVGRVHVDVGIGALSTRQSLHYAEHAEKHGAATFIVEMQTYLPGFEFADAHRHYSEIAKNVGVPLRLYNIPHTTRVDLLPPQIAAMSDIEGIDAVKDATGNSDRVREIKHLCGDRFAIFTGRHHNALESYRHGAIGWEGAFLPIFGDDMVALHKALYRRDFEEGERLYEKLEPLFTLFKYYGVPQCIKKMSSWTDNYLGRPRSPIKELNEQQSNNLKRVLTELGYI
jgi:4-hydroxy-tetrahydrodipicolinate synthase